MFSWKAALPVIQSLKLKDKDSTNLLLFLSEQKYRYKTDNNGSNAELLDSLFSLLNHVVSLTIQFSLPVSRAQLTESKVKSCKLALQKKIHSFLENIQWNSLNMPSVSMLPSPSFHNSPSYIMKSCPNEQVKDKPRTPIKVESKPNNLKKRSIGITTNNTPTRNQPLFFSNSMIKSNKSKKCKSVDKSPVRKDSESMLYSITSLEKRDKDKKNKQGLTDIKPFHNAKRLVCKSLNVIDNYNCIKTEENEKKRNVSGGKSCANLHH